MTKNNYFNVTSIDDNDSIQIETERVQAIVNKAPCEVEEEEVAALLETIEWQRQGDMSHGAIHPEFEEKQCYESIADEVLERTIVTLLNYYDVMELISIFEELKYYEIEQICEAGNPVEAIRELLN